MTVEEIQEFVQYKTKQPLNRRYHEAKFVRICFLIPVIFFKVFFLDRKIKVHRSFTTILWVRAYLARKFIVNLSVGFTVALRIFCLGWLSAFSCALLNAQPSEQTPSEVVMPVEPSAAPTPVKEFSPIFYAWSEDRQKLVPVANLTPEKLQEFIEWQNSLLATKPAPFLIERMIFSGQVVGERVELDVQIRIRITDIEDIKGKQTADSRWLRVPLGFHTGNCFIPVAPAAANGDTLLMEFENDKVGYVVWIPETGEEIHDITVKLVSAIDSSGGENWLRFTTANTTYWKAILNIPGNQKSLLKSQLSETHAGTDDGEVPTTIFKVEGAGDSIEVGWRPILQSVDSSSTQFDVDGQISIAIEAPDSISTRAELTVTSLGETVPPFVIRLPQDTELRAGFDTSSYQVFPLAADVAPSDDRLYVRVEPKQAVTKLTVILNVALSPDDSEDKLLLDDQRSGSLDARRIDLGGFDVVGAARQRGDVFVQVIEKWSVVWEPVTGVYRREVSRQSDSGPAATARFTYRQPFSLIATVKEKARHFNVGAAYRLHASADQIDVIAAFQYLRRGVAVRDFVIEANDWNVDRIEPAQLIDAVDLKDGLVRITLQSEWTSPEEFTLTIHGHRNVNPNASQLLVPLMMPREKTIVPARVEITSAANVEVQPRYDECVALIPAVQARPLSESETLDFTFEQSTNVAEEPLLALEMKNLAQSMEVAVAADLQLESGRMMVEENFQLDVLHEPLKSIRFGIGAAFDADQIKDLRVRGNEFSIDNVELQLVESDLPGESSWECLVPIPDARIGKFDFVVSYSFPIPQVSEVNSELAFPLIHLKTSAIVTTDLVSANLAWPMDWDLEMVDAKLLMADLNAPLVSTSRGKLEFDGSLPPTKMTLRYRLASDRNAHEVEVRRAWIQTWLESHVRTDRAVFRFQTRERRIRVNLPPQTQPDSVRVLLDRNHIEQMIPSDGMLDVPVLSPGEHLLEVWSKSEVETGFLGGAVLPLTTLAGPQRTWQTRWQLVTPGNEHLIQVPANVISEMNWAWNNMLWGRSSNLRQSDLERWVGVAPATPIESETNEYLFTSFDAIDSISVAVVPRHFIFAAISFPTLIVGLLLLRFPPTRHPKMLLVAGVICSLSAVVYPESSLLILQAASVGIALIILANILRRLIGRQGGNAPVIRGRTVSTGDSRVSEVELDLQSVDFDSVLSTATVAVASSRAVAESEL